MNPEKEQMNVVIVGHVDHGKSTLIGRLLADTGSLPDGKLEAVKANCARNARPFEYAFLLDALKDEQSQGITIDTARSFFKSDKRDYIIIDAPGHIEFLKNMVTGAARAEAALLVIDAHEGIRENSKRHGYMMSFLGIKNVAVCVNKMDLVKYDEKTFNLIKEEYTKFLKEINLTPKFFIPISAREGDNVASKSSNMPWYKGEAVLGALDGFVKLPQKFERDLRMPVQDVYKFTAAGDDRRIFAGRIESGVVKIGDEIVFLPSGKRSKVKAIEAFNVKPLPREAFAGQSAGITLETQIYVRPGEVICRASDKLPHVNNKFKANVFWMGKQPLVKNKNYKLKLTNQHVPVVLSDILSVLDASELSSISQKPQVDRHDVAECVFETLRPIAFDEVAGISELGRFVIVDNYEIAGGGIILAPVYESGTTLDRQVRTREFSWVRSPISKELRGQRHNHKPALILITGATQDKANELSKALEEALFKAEKHVYFLGITDELLSNASESNDKTLKRFLHVQQLGEMAHVLLDAGLLLITSVADLDDYELEMLKTLSRPSPAVVINIGDNNFKDEKSVDLNLTEDNLLKSLPEILAKIEDLTQLDPEFAI